MTLWLIQPDALQRRMDAEKELRSTPSGIALPTAKAHGAPRSARASGGVGTVQLSGVLIKARSLMDEVLQEVFGLASTSYIEAARQVAQLAGDPKVKRIDLLVDSPGGTTAGVELLAGAVRHAAKIKPVRAVVPDLAASAALWVASQATEVRVGPTAVVGSIGTLLVVEDSSDAFASAGVEVFVISSGGVKGAGVPGSEVTKEHIAEWQGLVDKLTGLFVDAVATGRNMSPEDVRQLATGEVWVGADAVRVGLADEVEEPKVVAPAKNRSTKAAARVVPSPVARVARLEAELTSLPGYSNVASSNAWVRSVAQRRRTLEAQLSEARSALPKPPRPQAPKGRTVMSTQVATKQKTPLGAVKTLAAELRQRDPSMSRTAAFNSAIKRLSADDHTGEWYAALHAECQGLSRDDLHDF